MLRLGFARIEPAHRGQRLGAERFRRVFVNARRVFKRIQAAADQNGRRAVFHLRLTERHRAQRLLAGRIAHHHKRPVLKIERAGGEQYVFKDRCERGVVDGQAGLIVAHAVA